MTKEKTATCSSCATSFSYEAREFNGRELFYPDVCDACYEKISNQRLAKQAQLEAEMKKAQRAKEWEQICPPLYRDTDPVRLPTIFRESIEKWILGPKGLGFVGSAGSGKTRAAFLLLRRLHFSGIRVVYVSHVQFASFSRNQFSEDKWIKYGAIKAIERFQETTILLLDDVGKAKDTDRVGEELYKLLEHRTQNKLPTIWTSNSNAAQLSQLISEDRADAVLRRLSEFSEIKTI